MLPCQLVGDMCLVATIQRPMINVGGVKTFIKRGQQNDPLLSECVAPADDSERMKAETFQVLLQKEVPYE